VSEKAVKYLALILAVQAEVDGMKSENTRRDGMGSSLAYDELDFQRKADELRCLASHLNN
jgi:hypothetical protein